MTAWLSKDEADEVERRRQRTELAKYPRKPIKLSPEERKGPWARKMAKTRALSRAISTFTGLALQIPEEREE